MIRVLLFFALLFLLALGFAWMADLPGVISVSWQGYVWEQPPVVVAIVAGILLFVFLLAVWLISAILRSPKIATRFFRRRRRDKGYEALSHGLIALGTGNAKLARRYGLDAEKLLKGEPAAKLLLAQTAQLAGRNDEARALFESMLDEPETRALGLHGLFIEAEQQNEPVAARHYAEEAAKTQPGLEWAGKAVLGYQAIASHWDQALTTLERNYSAKLLDKKTYRRQRAVILTALAEKLEDQEPERSFSLAKEAHGLAQDLVPAAVITSRLATRRGDVRKASKVVETTWRLAPHPDLADAYAHVRTGDSAVDRLKRVKSLAAQRANTSVGALAVARAAMEAREFTEAREQLKKVLQSDPTRGAFLLMAELEEAEHGDVGRMRDWLARAVRAPLDKAWVADGIVSSEWRAVSPVTGQLDVFEWTTPNQLPGQEDGQMIEDSLFEAPVLPAGAGDGAADQTADAPNTSGEEPAPKVHMKEINPRPPEAADTSAEKAAQTGKDDPAVAAGPHTKPGGYEGTTDDIHHAPAPAKLPDTHADAATGAETPKGASPEKTVDVPEGETSEPEQSAAAAGSLKDKVTPDASEQLVGAAPVERGRNTTPSAGETSAPEEPSGAGPETSTGQQNTQDTGKNGQGKAASTAEETDLDKPIEFPFNRMPDDPGPADDEDDSKKTQSKFFN
ncbi:HemY protein [Roseibium hamelinense]|uniref:HemY protein n=1 Tax=Roseibium hamelinense TaxID=150831 RepID=A0A562SF71_9HYPH|nr:heme biosynthesis HemY N-terminal domain-containing protein [Roseibium hamelinense]MTI42890.1 heme biosynthesis protein HemY [Roseibium hamelinense]TWI79922.1 HemY protein [Roseibium hamelinense]